MGKQRSGFSEFLHLRRTALGKKWQQILSDAYLSAATLHRIRHADPHRPIAEVDSLRSLANALEFNSWDAMIEAYDRQDPAFGLGPTPRNGKASSTREKNAVREDPLVTLSRAFQLSPTELARRLALGTSSIESGGSAVLPSALRSNELRPVRLVPHFSSGVAASRRVEKLEDEDHDLRNPAATDDLRVFTIPVDGDCQEPVWNNGDIVLFSFDACEREGIIPGKSYYLAFTDGSTTFKRVFADPDDPNVYILRCWNTKKYPGDRRVSFEEVVRIARAVSKQVTPEE